VCANYANGDMVGHTGNLAAATRAIEAIDECLGRVTEAMRETGSEVLITADHGNAELMHDEQDASGTLPPIPERGTSAYIGRQSHDPRWRCAAGRRADAAAHDGLAAAGGNDRQIAD